MTIMVTFGCVLLVLEYLYFSVAWSCDYRMCSRSLQFSIFC